MINHYFGHAISTTDGKTWAYVDTGETIGVGQRTCPKCGIKQTAEGHDPCIALLPGVDFACCGHGVTRGYIKFTNGVVLRGDFHVVERWNNGQECERIDIAK